MSIALTGELCTLYRYGGLSCGKLGEKIHHHLTHVLDDGQKENYYIAHNKTAKGKSGYKLKP